MITSFAAVDMPWNRLLDELHQLEQARRPSEGPDRLHEPTDGYGERRAFGSQLSGLAAALDKAVDAIRSAQAQAEPLEQEHAAVVEDYQARLRAAEAACEARDARAQETIRHLELRARTAEERVRVLEARLESARRALDGTLQSESPLEPVRPNPSVKGPQPFFKVLEGDACAPASQASAYPSAEPETSDDDGYDDVCEAIRQTLIGQLE
jgi:hypothetical protein